MNVIEKPQHSNNIIKNILINAGIEDIQKFINPDSSDDIDVKHVPYIQNVYNIIEKNKHSKIFMLVDSDCDGFTSSAIMYKYLNSIYDNLDIELYMHPNKEHGLTKNVIKKIKEVQPKMVIVIDAGTNDIEEHSYITKELKADLLIIDHHIQTRKGDSGIIISNHLQEEKNELNKAFTGATLSYLVTKALDINFYFTDKYLLNRDLATIGTVADVADLRSNEVRNLMLSGICNINSKFLKSVAKSNNQELKDITLKKLSYGGIIPLINSVIRVGTVEEKWIIFKALAEIDNGEVYAVEKRKLNKEIRKYNQVLFKFDIYDYATDIGLQCRQKQNKIVNAEIKLVDNQFNPKAGIQIYKIQNEDTKKVVGLLANKLTDKWQQPVYVVRNVDGFYKGSLRGYDKTLKNFKGWSDKTNLFEYVEGHNQAAGICFKVENLDKLIKCTESVVKEDYKIEVEKLYQNHVKGSDITLVDNNKHMLENGLKTFKFGVEDLTIKKKNIQYTKNTLRLTNEYKITYIKFKVSEEDYNEIMNVEGDTVTFKFAVGEFSVNEWKFTKYNQFIINEYMLKEKEEVKPVLKKVIDYGIFG